MSGWIHDPASPAGKRWAERSCRCQTRAGDVACAVCPLAAPGHPLPSSHSDQLDIFAAGARADDAA